MSEGASVIAIVIAMIFTAVAVSIIDSQFEAESCKALEQRIGINLVYTYGSGCKLAEDY